MIEWKTETGGKKGEEEFLARYDSGDYPRIAVAVDLLVFTIEENELKVLTIRRAEHPYKGCLALPGVFVGPGETLDQAAERGLREETGLEGIYCEQLYSFGEVDRDPRMRVVSVTYMALTDRELLKFRAGERTCGAELVPVSGIMGPGEGDDPGKEGSGIRMAFDHSRIISYGKWRLKNKVEYTDISFHLVPDRFTLPELQRVWEILLEKPLFKANFRKKIAPMIEETEEYTSGDAHRPSRYYRRKTVDPDRA